jgi:hypothetical protein
MLKISHLSASVGKHASEELIKLFRVKSIDAAKVSQVVSRLVDDPYQIKAATGKQAAITLYYLNRIATKLPLDHPSLDSVILSTAERSCKLVSDAMDEHSIAITCMALLKHGDKIPPDLMTKFVYSIPRDRLTRMKDPRNTAQMAYFMGNIESVPIGIRVEALNSWIKTALLGFCPARFKVKDLVQIMHAYNKAGIAIDSELLKHLEEAIFRQLQYMDHLSTSVIIRCLGSVETMPSKGLLEGLLATAAQQIGTFNPQSLFSILVGISRFGDLKTNCLHQVSGIIKNELPRLFTQFPTDKLAHLLVSVHKFDNVVCVVQANREYLIERLHRETNEGTVITLLTVLQKMDLPASDWDALGNTTISPRFKVSRSRKSFTEVKNAISLLSYNDADASFQDAISCLVSDVERLNSVFLGIQLFSLPVVPPEAVAVVDRIIQSQSLSVVSDSELVSFATKNWLHVGSVHEKIVSETQARKLDALEGPLQRIGEWITNSKLDKGECAVCLFPGMEKIPRNNMFRPPHPGWIPPELPSRFERLVTELDPELFLMHDICLLTTTGPLLKKGDICYAYSQRRRGPVVIIPRKHFDEEGVERVALKTVSLLQRHCSSLE